MKNKLFYIVFTLFFTILGSSTIFAQSTRQIRRMPPQEKAELRADVLSERLILDKSQQEIIEAIYLKYVKKRVALRKKMQNSPQRKEVMFELRQAEITEVKTVLSDTQKTTYAKILSGEVAKLNFRNTGNAR